MQVAKDKVVSFEFKVTDEQGQVLDSSEGMGAFPYIHGNGYLIPGLEAAMEGKSPQDSFSVSVPPELGYGEREENLSQVIPRAGLEGIELEIGMKLEAQYKGGSRIVTITEIDDTSVTLDGNHPLAGMTINFDVTVIDVRDATPEELQHGHPIMPGQADGCGCGCGCEEDVCDDTCNGGHCH